MLSSIDNWSTTQLCKAAKGRARAVLSDGTEVYLLFWDTEHDRVRVQAKETRHHFNVEKTKVQYVSTVWPGMNPSDLGVDIVRTPEIE